MSLQIITPSSWQIQPWKNGGGLTQELAIEKDASGIVWRLSIADVTHDGPFSLFPGRDRILFLLEGEGMELHFSDGSSKRLDQRLLPFSFAGEKSITSSLLEGPIRDFNVMTCRDRCHADVEVLHLQPLERSSLQLLKKQFFYVAAGSITVLIKEKEYHFEEKNLLILDTTTTDLILVGETTGATLIGITLTYL